MSQLTFITAYLKVYEDDYDDSKTFDNRLNYFKLLLKTGVNICIFVEPNLREKFNMLEIEYGNLKVVDYLTIYDLESYKTYKNSNLSYELPNNRNTLKDTDKYMFLMIAKTEFIKRTINVNPYNSDYFCWIDFSIAYIFKDIYNTTIKIKKISDTSFQNDFIYIPGCWNYKINDIEYLKNNIVWRFCGGFVIGDKNSLSKLCDICSNNLLYFLQQTNKLVWEVNYWSWLERNDLINIIWYKADHDDSIINIPFIFN